MSYSIVLYIGTLLQDIFELGQIHMSLTDIPSVENLKSLDVEVLQRDPDGHPLTTMREAAWSWLPGYFAR